MSHPYCRHSLLIILESVAGATLLLAGARNLARASTPFAGKTA